MQTTVVIPTYNEAENLAAMVDALFTLPRRTLTLIIVDDGSPDGTGEIADRLAAIHAGRIDVVHRTGKLGLGTAYNTGFRRALAQGAEVVVQMDADFSHSPRYIPAMVEALRTDQADVVVGSRYVPGGELDERWSWWRYFLSWWANQVYSRAVLNIRTRDATAGFKAWRRATLDAIDLDQVRSNGYVFQVEMAYLTEKLGFRVLEIPIYFEDRRIGKSKMTVPVKLEAAWRVWQIRWRHRNAVARTVPKVEPTAASLAKF
ncbi:MAG: polyprenol monophosphomannose synthase [Ardenticatenaceae bacterium]|nr:polyprenol monophosphomannose synthase [Ardenticatenaceae bacterium]HBY95047.1 polyprenol monophosphomannose synthase [Chloroflexota bacterium]